MEGASQTYSIQEAIDHMRFNRFQVVLSLVAGICWISESLEMMLLVILAPILQCVWFLPPWQQAFLSTLVMGGMSVSSGIWGILGDKYGRKPILVISCVSCGFYGVLSALSPIYTWIAINRFLVGACLGALPQALILYSEYLTTDSRSTAIVLFEFFAAFGSVLGSLIAKLVVPTFGWRYFLAISALPSFTAACITYWIPESARYYLSCGRYNDAVNLLSKVAKTNRTTLPPGRLDRPVKCTERGNVGTLLSKDYRCLTIGMLSCWFLNGVCYFGVVLLLPTLLTYPDHCHGFDIQPPRNQTCNSRCVTLTDQDYNVLIVTALADSPGVFVSVVFLQFMGRKKCIALDCFIYSTCLILCNVCVSRTVLVCFLFVARGAITGAYQTLYLYTSEAYPTHVRALAVGLGSCTSRMGAVVTPYIAQVLTQYNAYMSITAYGMLAASAGVIALILQVETKGTAMKEEEGESEYKEID